ncbi:MAG: 3-isopropylmalate dehydratase small subunit [Chloroflexi bacterium]|jgi:3-isopropylmalate/(R)-2-methylmalate dehydratase small subunit|nr:3-isopropylmalate dehydratase small subunit [Chloroflexota bacterium]MBT4002098.1 3-isopropylmalate dehydratase small subunit [Chloroflexota bacterium]MBT4305667.1 3-isopropylmalate dehydratase small subunit [Chloroflexota bacterium]MBT4533491.1 3-isopropylmalate dehydratase small subunit [Chloroflexota bacterium]MBT4681866.1 3-isopropylmalate dehydratase small subunit [Chloroflexota bacterium]
MNNFNTITSKVIPLPRNNIDTDQIIPARYLKATDKVSVAEGLFADWRFYPDGSPNQEFIINQKIYQNAEILLAGDNFGCGSSREHAPWAITGNGIKAVISTSFADIFKNNALKNNLLPITVDPEIHKSLLDLSEEAPEANISIDLETQKVFLPAGQEFDFQIDPFAKKCLLNGVDQLGYILSFEANIAEYEKTRKSVIIQ